jgi:hypothetical protein
MQEAEASEPPFRPAPIEELFRAISKAARAHQMYLPNNPVYRGAIETLRGAFRPIWAETDEICLEITESEIRWYDVAVAGDAAAAKSADSLAWLFFKDGVRELRIAKGFEDTEVVTLLDIIQRARKGGANEDDLVAMLWEADLAFLQYKYVDLLQDGGGPGGELADGSEVTPAAPGDVQRGAREAVEESRAGTIVNMAEFDATLYFLDEREIDYLQLEIKREYQQDLRMNLVAVLLDIFELQSDPEIRAEVLEDLHSLMVHLLAAGHFHGVAQVLRESQIALERTPNLTTGQRKKLGELPERLSGPDALSQLLQALDEATALPTSEELAALFDLLQPAALATLFQWMPKIQSERLRPMLESAAGRLAAANTAELVRLVQVADLDVSSEAIRRAGALKAQAAVLALSRILLEPDVARRLLAVQALLEIGSPGALQSLEKAIEDTDRDVRITAVRAVTARAYRPALARLDTIVKGKAIREADRTEKMAFFEGFGALCGDAGVAHLDAILNGKGFLGRRDDPEVRACAAMALARVGTPLAIESLRRASVEKDVVVRNAVARALRGSGTPGGPS